MAFYDAVGGGSRDQKSLASFLLGVFNPLSRTNSNLKNGKGYDGNLKGEGLITGGVLVLCQGDGRLEYGFHEQAIGDHAPVDAVIAAAVRSSEAPPECAQ
mmetsp:Transcript_19560/g.50520  ORF Transcript_19560/g.50520 Transcript_19560/m.50520 type:complete len:100 (-) Transcript_19560:343-642(-)